MTKQEQTPKPAEHGKSKRRFRASLEAMRTRSASDVFRMLKTPVMNRKDIVPIGLWKTGTLPKPQGSAS